ncbi:MAG: MBL fold metallo-hydrolase [Spirochaetaceae bacterium]|jgi:phosphoribosyl 1,2-cyclic phosphodiesterase|nr:MBL fold metallo-hydrolase [Spirochaetaceae bacterium]
MFIRFWGVRGSLPAPQEPGQIKSKISAIIERLSPEDLENQQSRERFLAALPPWLFGTVGGNSPCVELRPRKNSRDLVIFDAGTGIRELGIALAKEKIKDLCCHVFFSHFHWDHLQGLPFFGPAYDPSTHIIFHSPMANLETTLHGQMSSPYFPVHMESMGSRKTFDILSGPMTLGNLKLSYKKMNHPGDSYSYRIDDGEHVFIYSTDTELSANDFLKNEENSSYFENADLIVIDSQYTLGEAIEKYNWGHSAFSLAVDFAANWSIKHMVLFHHDPTYDDRKLYNILQSARWYSDRMGIKGVKITLAREGLEIIL